MRFRVTVALPFIHSEWFPVSKDTRPPAKFPTTVSMKAFFYHCSFLIFILLLPAIAGAQAIYTYTNASGGAYNFLAANLTATGITQVGTWGSNTPCSNGGGISGITVSPAFGTYNPTDATSPALNVDITPNAGYALNITSITVSLRRSGTGPTQAMMAYSIDGGLTWTSKGTAESPNNGSCGSFSNHTWTLSSPVALCGNLFKFRVYYYAAGAITGTIQFANLNINGSVASSTSSVTHINESVCAAQLPFTWRGHTVTAGGIAVAADTFINSHGCDSIIALDLEVKNPVQVVIRDTTCRYALPYIWNGISIAPAGNTAIEQVTGTGANGCDSVTVLQLYVSGAPVPVVYSHPPACGTTSFEGHNYTNSTTFNDTLKTTYGCDSAYRKVIITVYPFPVVNLGNDTVICKQDHILLHAGNPGYSYLWNTGATTATIQTSDSGRYTVTVTSPEGCATTAHRHIGWHPAPYTEGFNFIPYFYQHLGKVAFQPLNPRNVTRYLWDFGDGHTSTDVNPVHTFDRNGTFLVTLTVFNNCGSETYTLPIHVDVATGIIDGGTMQAGDILLYPNPSKDLVTVSCQDKQDIITGIRIYNIQGRLMYQLEAGKTGIASQQVDVASFTPGIYTVTVRTNKGAGTRKFEVLR